MRKSKKGFKIYGTAKLFAIVLVIISVYLVIFCIYMDWHPKTGAANAKRNYVKVPYVIVHLDLKGAPPKLSYLESLLPTFKEYGANGLLLEYEDMFPYTDKLLNLSAKNCYSRSELTNFLSVAVNLGFEIIPLVQTFGHMEHVLKLREFKHLREVPEYPHTICPTQPESNVIIKLMLDQVISFHNNVTSLKHIHVGCDEVFHIKVCDHCLKINTSVDNIFLDHVITVVEIVKEISPKLTAMIWDDMFRTMREFSNFDNVEVVYWDYRPSVILPRVSFFHYKSQFKNIWGAAAFKGADGATASVPDLKSRTMNIFSWMKLMVDHESVYSFKGLILTGWSRYSHMQPLCELLPVSLPSLLLSLRIIKQFELGVSSDYFADIDINKFSAKYLTENIGSFNCNVGTNIAFFDASSCSSFTDIKLFYALVELSDVIHDIYLHFQSDYNEYSTIEFYSQTQEIDINSLEHEIKAFNNTLTDLLTIETKIVNAMKMYFDDFVINEYVGYKTYFTKQQLLRLKNSINIRSVIRVWERRPATLYYNISSNTTV